jgi:sarcosine oxidase subunit alpha
MGVSVHHIERLEDGFLVHAGAARYRTGNLLLATGAAESPAPIPGWTLPGVMTVGAAQVMANVHRVRAGRRGIIVGVNVLAAAIARELQLAGMTVEAIVLPASNTVTREGADPRRVMENLTRISHLAPSAFIRQGGRFASSAAWAREAALRLFPQDGVKLWGMPVHLRKAAVRINGTDRVESVTLCKVTPEGVPVPGTEQTVEVDFVCIAGGLYPLAELAVTAGCPFRAIEELGGYVPVHNERMETPVPGLFVAGNITGIESAKVARAQGTVAGLSIALRARAAAASAGGTSASAGGADALERELAQAVEQVKAVRRAATIQFHPHIERGRQKMEEAFREEA